MGISYGGLWSCRTQGQHTTRVYTFSFTFTNTRPACVILPSSIFNVIWLKPYLSPRRLCLFYGHSHSPIVEIFPPNAEIHASSWIQWHPCLGERFWSMAKRMHHNRTCVSLSHFASESSEDYSGGSAWSWREDETRGDGLAGSPALPQSSIEAAPCPAGGELTPSRRLQKYTQHRR